jgi:dipeptidyl aminopeptidase/acylaminoacyl peptidase
MHRFKMSLALASELSRQVSCFAAILGLFIGACLNVPAKSQRLRLFTTADMLRLEEMGETALSPDGEILAYVIKRAKAYGSVDPLGDLNNNEHADIWIRNIRGNSINRNLTNGLSSGNGYWAPRWSPDGQHLGMLSVENGKQHLSVWERTSSKLVRVSRGDVDAIAVENAQDPYVWTSNHEICFVAQSESRISSPLDAAILAWSNSRKGTVTTRSVLESGRPPQVQERPQKTLVSVDVISKQERTIDTGLGYGQLLISPNRKYLAVLKQMSVWQPDSTVEMVTVLNPAIYQLFVVDLPEYRFKNFSGLSEAVQGSPLWSVKEDELALVGYRSETGRTQIIFKCGVNQGTCRLWSDHFQDLDPNKFNRFLRSPFIWKSTGELLVSSSGEPLPGKRKSWWEISPAGTARKLLGDDTPVSQVVPEFGTSNLVGIVNGSLVRISPDDDSLQQILPSLKLSVRSIVWTDCHSNSSNLRTRRLSSVESVKEWLVVEVENGSSPGFYLINVRTGESTSVPKSAPNARLVAVDTKTKTTIQFADTEAGTYLWASKSIKPIVGLNKFLSEIKRPEQQRIDYYSADGELLKAWVMLPNNYSPGTRVPTIVWVYPSAVYGAAPPSAALLQKNPFDLSLLAARGYAVLQPSMPLRLDGEAQDTYIELTKGVLPAVQKLIDLGIADADRVGLFGHSFGGFATYGLITQTNLFRAAVASAGIANWTSLYGTFDPKQRYQDDAHENLMRMWGVETLGMARPPWKDLGRYLRNSPITYAERVETPLLIIQGEFDTESQLQQGEEFFTALQRQNKRARFVRYFGDSHVIESPANVRDMWDQIFAWFDEFLRRAPDNRNKVGEQTGQRR